MCVQIIWDQGLSAAPRIGHTEFGRIFRRFFFAHFRFRWHHCVYVIFINGSVRTYLATSEWLKCWTFVFDRKYRKNSTKTRRTCSVRWCRLTSNLRQTSSDNKCWLCALLCECRGGGANLRQFVRGIQNATSLCLSSRNAGYRQCRIKCDDNKHEWCESDLRHTHVEHAARTHIGIDFSRSFLIPTNFGAVFTDTGAGAHTHSHIPRRYTRWKTSRMCFWLWWWFWHGKNHACIFVDRFSNFPCDGHSLAAIAFSPRRKDFRLPRECVYALHCACVLLARFECFRRLVLFYHSSIFRSKMCVEIFSAHFRLLNFLRFLREHVWEIRFDLFLASMVAREVKTSCEAH